MAKVMHALIMTEDGCAALACIQSFGGKGHSVSVVVNQQKSPHCHSRFVKNIVSLPIGLDDFATCCNLIELTEKLKIDVVVPISDCDAKIVALAKERAPNNNAFVTPSVQSIDTARDRNNTTILCRRLGIPTPPTVYVEEQTNVAEEAKSLGFPLFVKASGTSASQGVHYAGSPTELDAIFERLPKSFEFQLQKKDIGRLHRRYGFCRRRKVDCELCLQGKV